MTVEGLVGITVGILGIGSAIGSYFKSKYDTENNKNEIVDIKAAQEQIRKEFEQKWKENSEGDAKLEKEFIELKAEYKGVKGLMEKIDGKLDNLLDKFSDLTLKVSELEHSKQDK